MANSVAEAAEAIKLLAEALRLDDELASAHAFMSLAYGQIFRSAAGPARDDARAKAVVHARRAIETAGEDSTALAHAGFTLLLTAQDIAGARAAVDKAVALNPNHAAAHAYRSLVRAVTGEPEPAMEDAHHALRLNPLDPTGYLPQMALVVAHVALHRYDDAVVRAHRAIEHSPPRYPMSYAWLIVAECARGNTLEAERQMNRLADILPGFGPDMLERLFDFFPEPLRSDAVAVLRQAGLIAGRVTGS
jgi:tetratricopeptide (TPR) repeat protein